MDDHQYDENYHENDDNYNDDQYDENDDNYNDADDQALDNHFTASLSPASRDPLPLSARLVHNIT